MAFYNVVVAMITSTLMGMLLWSLMAAHGAGEFLALPTTQDGSRRLDKYSQHEKGALFGQSFAAPLTVVLTAFLGILIISAASALYRQVFWSSGNPFLLLLFLQSKSASDPATRAGTLIAGLGLLASQMSLCIVLNSVSADMDLTTLSPQ